MSGKRMYSVVPIYASALVWILWVAIIHPQTVLSYSLCTVISAVLFAVLYRAFPPIACEEIQTSAEQTALEDACENSWDRIEKISKKYAALFSDKPISTSLQSLNDNVREINKAIKADSKRADNQYIRRFESIFSEYCKDLPEYETCSKIKDPGHNVKKILQLTEDRFATLATVSKALVDEVYGGNILSLKAENDVLKQLFTTLQSESDFKVEQQEQEGTN